MKGTIHWVSVRHAHTAEVRFIDRLFKVEDPNKEEGDFKEYINPESLDGITHPYISSPRCVKHSLTSVTSFYVKDTFASTRTAVLIKLFLNRTVSLKTHGQKK